MKLKDIAQLNEALPSMVPEFPVQIAGFDLKLRFDVNINKTKKGIKLQFVMPNVPEDPRKAQDMANAIGSELQKRFGDAKLQIMYDVENPYKNVVGFLVPLPSIADYIMKKVGLGGVPGEEEQQPEQQPAEEPKAEPLPSEEQPPSEEDQDLREMFMQRAGVRVTVVDNRKNK